MTDPSRHGETSSHRSSGTITMIVGTVVAALGAYGFQVVVGRRIGSEAFAPIAVLWTVQFLAFTTVFMPMEQLTIRRLTADEPGRSPWRLFGAVIVATAGLAMAFTVILHDRLFDAETTYVAIVGFLIVAYGGFALGRGALAGNHRYREYGLATLFESVLRLAAAIALLALGIGAVGLAWTLVIGPLVVYAWRPFGGDLGKGREVARGTAASLTAFVGATAASQTLVAAGPLAVGLLGGNRSEISIFFETFLLFRAPLTIAYSLIARVMPPFTSFVESGRREVLRKWAVRLGILGAVAGVVGYFVGSLVGPAAVAFLLGEEFRPLPGLAGYGAAGVGIATVALFTQQMLIALRATLHLAAAWIIGLAAAVIVITITFDTASMRVGLGFLVGEIVAFGLIVVFALTTLQRAPVSASPKA